MPWLIIAGVVLIIYLLCQMVEFILGVFNRTYPIVSLLCFFPVLALIIFLGTVLSSEIDVTLEDTIQFGLAIALELILIVAALSLLYCYKNSKERSITLKMRFSISYSPFTKKIMSNETAIVFKEEYSGEIQEKLLAPLEYDESSEEQYGKQYFVEHDFIFRKVSHGTRFSFSLIDHKDRKYELLWNGECSSPRNTKVPFVDTRMDVDISLAMVRFEMFMLANERLENKTLEPKVKLNNYPLNINTEYRVPKGTYEIDFSVPDELLGSWCLEIDGRTVYEKSNVLSFKVEKDTHIPISLKEISPTRIFIELENANGAEQNYTLLMAKKIVLQNVKTKKEYSITEDGDRLFFEVPGGVYAAEVNSLVFGKYYIRGEFGDSGLEKTEIEIGYGQESEVVLKAFGYPLKQVIFSLTDVKSINLISNVTVENTEGVLYSGKTSKNTVQFSLPEGSYKAQFSLKEVDKTYVEVLVNNKPGKTHRFEVKRTDLLIPIEVRKTEWPKLQLNISNPSNAAVSVLVDELTVENHAIQVKKGVHKIKLSIPQDNELFSYESFINGTEGKSYSLKIEDSTSVLIEIKKTQKLESTNHKLDLLDLASVDYYSLLGVDETATAQEIKRAYALALRRSSTNDDCSSIRKAYEILSSESLKSKYDSYRKYGRSIRSMMNEAEECFSRDEDNKALAITEEILNIDPDLVEARRLRSMCLTKVDRIMDSVKEMEKVILLDPLNPEHWLYCGMGYRRLFGDTEKAKYFDQAKSKTLVAVDLQPYNAEPYIALAELFIDNSDFDEALEYCDRAINADGKIDIHDFEAMFLKAKIHILASDPERTRDVADEILEAIPDDQEIREYVAAKFLEYSRLFYKNKNLELAILFIENAMKFDKSKELRGFRDHLKIANDAVGEIKTYESDSTIIRPIKALAGILIQKNYLTVDDEEEKELDDLFDKWLKSLNDIRVSTIRDSINLTRKNYPKIYIACKKFFIALEEAIS